MALQFELVEIWFLTPEVVAADGRLIDLGVADIVWPSQLRAANRVEPGDLLNGFFSTQIRPADVPLAFHRGHLQTSILSRTQPGLPARLDRLAETLFYVFEASDGQRVRLSAQEALYHDLGRQIPRPLLPLQVNLPSSPPPTTLGLFPDQQRGAAQVDAELMIAYIIHNALKLRRSEVISAPLFWVAPGLGAAPVETCLWAQSLWQDWRVESLGSQRTDPADPDGLLCERGRVQLAPQFESQSPGIPPEQSQTDGPVHRGLGFDFAFDSGRLTFHTRVEQTRFVRGWLGLHPQVAARGPVEVTGHSRIQQGLREVEANLKKNGQTLILPQVTEAEAKPFLYLLSDGSYRVLLRLGEFEVHGWPEAMLSLVVALDDGLLAQEDLRRSGRRDRTHRLAKHLGVVQLIAWQCAVFAGLGPREDDTPTTVDELVSRVLAQMEALRPKDDAVSELTSRQPFLSESIRVAVSNLVREWAELATGVDLDFFVQGRTIRVSRATRLYFQLFASVLGDMIHSTAGQNLSRSRAKPFEKYFPVGPDGQRKVLSQVLTDGSERDGRVLARDGVNERGEIPEGLRPLSAQAGLMGLMSNGWTLFLNGQPVEEFTLADFKPEFRLGEIDAHDEIDALFVAAGSKRIDWFELHPRFFFKGTEIPAEQAQRLSQDGLIEFRGRLFRIRADELPSLKRLNQFWARLQGVKAPDLGLKKRRRPDEMYFHLPKSRTLELLALRASGVAVHGGKEWQDICTFYDHLDSNRARVEVPESFQGQLQPYQNVGVQWLIDLYRLKLGGILADDMGLGKTVTSLAFLDLLRDRNELGPTLIVVPTSLTYNWQSEAQKFSPKLPVHLFNSREPEQMLSFIKDQSAGIVITTYGLLQENEEYFQQVSWNVGVFDEAQNLKNIQTKRATSARKLSVQFKICLTGTPLENHYGEFFSLFDLCVPGSLGDWSEFRSRFVSPTRVLREDLEDLKLRVRPLLLRRTKSQVMQQLPPKIETTLKLPFESEQLKIYRDIATSYNQQIRQVIETQGEARSQLQMLTALLRLRQACSDPAGIPGVVYPSEPPKISTLLEALVEVTESGSSALVFTQFLSTYARIRKALEASGIVSFDINGADNRQSREKKLRGFQETPNGAVLLMTLKTGGVGLNLTKANYIFHIEPWWNPAVENQATDRAHRMGQEKNVQVYRYLMRESVEEKIEVLKGIKSQRFDALLTSSESSEVDSTAGSQILSQQDFEYLLS